MVMRVSITLDPDTMDLIDRFAKEHAIDRNRAIIECIESGYAQLNAGVITPTLHQQRAYEEYHEILRSLEEVKKSLFDLADEARLIHHIIEVNKATEQKPVPFQTRKWWEFWKSP